jgi:hypothetical protein
MKYRCVKSMLLGTDGLDEGYRVWGFDADTNEILVIVEFPMAPCYTHVGIINQMVRNYNARLVVEPLSVNIHDGGKS